MITLSYAYCQPITRILLYIVYAGQVIYALSIYKITGSQYLGRANNSSYRINRGIVIPNSTYLPLDDCNSSTCSSKQNDIVHSYLKKKNINQSNVSNLSANKNLRSELIGNKATSIYPQTKQINKTVSMKKVTFAVKKGYKKSSCLYTEGKLSSYRDAARNCSRANSRDILKRFYYILGLNCVVLCS